MMSQLQTLILPVPSLRLARLAACNRSCRYNRVPDSSPLGSINFRNARFFVTQESYPDPPISKQEYKNSKKNLDSYCFVTFFGLFIFENDENVPSKSNKQKNCLNQFFVGILKVNAENSRFRFQDPDPNPGLNTGPNPDPLIRGMDPRIRIHQNVMAPEHCHKA